MHRRGGLGKGNSKLMFLCGGRKEGEPEVLRLLCGGVFKGQPNETSSRDI